jgi:hypothetical protein
MAGSHISPAADESERPAALTLVPSLAPSGEQGLPERLAGRVDEHLARFAEHIREGLLAASTALGLEVMAELMAAEVAELAGPKGKHDPDRVATRQGDRQGRPCRVRRQGPDSALQTP